MSAGPEQSAFMGEAIAPSAVPSGSGRDPQTGRFTSGTLASVGHGLFSGRDLADLNAEVAAFLAASIDDDGGESNISTRRRDLLEARARLRRRIIQLDNALEVRGLFARRGKLRLGWLQMLATLIEKARALDTTLGLQRRARRVPSLDEWIAERVGHKDL